VRYYRVSVRCDYGSAVAMLSGWPTAEEIALLLLEAREPGQPSGAIPFTVFITSVTEEEIRNAPNALGK